MPHVDLLVDLVSLASFGSALEYYEPVEAPDGTIAR
jgi:hypothetical protein